ncbi:Vps62-related protein [Pseudomonas sp. SDO52101_S400]
MHTQETIKSPTQPMDPIRVENLLISFTTEFHRLWDNKGSKSKPGSFWRPTPAPDLLPGYFPLGDVVVSGRDNINEQRAVAVVCEGDSQAEKKALSKPVDFKLVWRDTGSRANGDCSVWRPVPPEGYVALGLVCTNDSNRPSFNAIRCVRADLVIASSANTLIWNDQGSGANQDFSAWSIQPPVAPTGEIYFSPGTFVGAASYNKPATPITAYALRMPIPLQVDPAPAPPILTRNEASTALTPSRVTQVARLPWFAVTDADLRPVAQLRASPFYRVQRTDQYVLVGHGHNTDAVHRAFKWRADRVQSYERLRAFTRRTSIDLSGHWRSMTPTLQSGMVYSANLSDGFAHNGSTAHEWFNSASADVIALVARQRFAAVYVIQSEFRLLREDGSQVEETISYTDLDSLHLAEYPQEAEPPAKPAEEPVEVVAKEQELPPTQIQAEPQVPETLPAPTDNAP